MQNQMNTTLPNNYLDHFYRALTNFEQLVREERLRRKLDKHVKHTKKKYE